MRVLVAGGAGLIGNAACRALLDRGDEVVCADNLVTGSLLNVKRLLEHPRMTFVETDIAGSIPVSGSFDAVMNLACPASPADFGPLALEILETGSRGVANLLEIARRDGATFLQASTSEVYGEPLVHPQPETYWGNVNPIGPRSVYDEAKRFGEALVSAYGRKYGLEVRIARIFNTYGPGMRPRDGRVISNFVTQALEGRPLTIYGDGTQTRSFCFVEDEVEGILRLLGSSYPLPVNIGNDHERTMLEVAELVLDVTGAGSGIVFLERPPDDPTQRRPDLTVARRELGWEPTTDLREGLVPTARVAPSTALVMTPGAAAGGSAVAAVVVNYNTRSYLSACLGSLRSEGVSQTVVVDNASIDGSRIVAERNGASWVPSGGNLGYGRAANIGSRSAAASDAPYLLVCNPDIVVHPGTLASLVETMHQSPRVGLVGPRIENSDGSLYPSARSFPDLVDAVGHGALGLVAPENRFSRRYRMLDWDHSEQAEVDWVSGACFLVRRDAWDQVGGFDPTYFMYMEDVDLCWRLGRAGWSIAYQPAAVVTHTQGVSTDRRPYRMLAEHHLSMWRFAVRTSSGTDRAALPLVGVGLAFRLILTMTKRRLAGTTGAPPPGQLP